MDQNTHLYSKEHSTFFIANIFSLKCRLLYRLDKDYVVTAITKFEKKKNF